MKTTLRAANLSEKQIEEIYTVLSLICKQEKLQLEERGDRVVIEICPQYTIYSEELSEQEMAAVLSSMQVVVMK